MRLRTAVGVVIATVATAAPATAAYPEPTPGAWTYDQYQNTTFKVGSFRVKAGTATRPPRVARFRLRLDSARGRCPALGTRVAVVSGPMGLRQAPGEGGDLTRNHWVLDTTPVEVVVGGGAPVSGALSLRLLQDKQGGAWRWVVWDTELEVGRCTLTPISGRPRQP